jgi:hypothetical protein
VRLRQAGLFGLRALSLLPSPDVYLELIVMREGDATGTMTTQEVFEELDPALRDKLAAAMAGRMSASSTPE